MLKSEFQYDFPVFHTKPNKIRNAGKLQDKVGDLEACWRSLAISVQPLEYSKNQSSHIVILLQVMPTQKFTNVITPSVRVLSATFLEALQKMTHFHVCGRTAVDTFRSFAMSPLWIALVTTFLWQPC